jgi:hypothetical protein
MIESFRERLWEIEDNPPKPATKHCPAYGEEYTAEDDQMLDAIHDKLDKLYDYFETCEKKLAIVYDTLNRWNHEE